MVVDILTNRGRYKGLGSGIERALEYLSNTDFTTLEDGKHEIQGNEIYAVIATYDTEPESARKFEAHRKYLDVQYLLAGREIICWAPLEGLSFSGEYSEEKDIVFLSGDPRARLRMSPGSFALFFPQDAHKPNCAWNDPQAVRKVVVKIRVG